MYARMVIVKEIEVWLVTLYPSLRPGYFWRALLQHPACSIAVFRSNLPCSSCSLPPTPGAHMHVPLRVSSLERRRAMLYVDLTPATNCTCLTTTTTRTSRSHTKSLCETRQRSVLQTLHRLRHHRRDQIVSPQENCRIRGD